METSLSCLCPNFLLLPPKIELPKIWGGGGGGPIPPPPPPGPQGGGGGGGLQIPPAPRPVRLWWLTLREKSTKNLFRVNLIKKPSRSRELQTEFEQCF